MNNQEILKKEIEERDDLVKKAEALVNESDGNFSKEQKQKLDDLYNKIEEKDNYIAAKRKVVQLQGQKADVLDKGEEQELQNYSFREALLAAQPNGQKALGKKYGYYQELSEQGEKEAKEAGVSLHGNGLVIPFNALSKRPGNFRNDLTVTTEGTDIVETNFGSFIDQLNEMLVLRGLGADFLTGLSGNIQWPRETNAPTFTWEGETDANAESTPTFDNVQLSPNRGGTFIDVSNQALRQTSPAIDARIERQLLGAVQRGIETAAINGSGTAPEPEGILNTTGIGSNDIGTNGGVQTWDAWVANETSVAVANADMGSLGYLTNAKVRGQAKTTKIDAGSGQFIWPVNATEVNGYPVGISNLVPSNLTKGTGTGLSALIFGNFNDLIIGQWGGIEVLVDPYTQATSGLTRMVINVYVDVAVLRAGSFSATQDINA